MNKKTISLILGLMCVVLTFGIAVQIKTINGTGTTISTNTRENELRDAVLKAKEMGYDKIIVVLTQPNEFRKKKNPSWIAKLFYNKYPNLIKAINTRYIKYNETLDIIKDLENKKEIFVIRPSEKLNIKRIEKD